jgi:competence protein ComEC
LRKGLPAPQGGIAAALTTGDRSGIPDDVREKFVASGLAHILAISGLHLSIVAGLIFFMIRKGTALIPPLALRVNTKKIAALGAIIVTGLYLGLSGFGVPAQRAFLMTSLVMVAILINRNAFSLRTVAFAATVILLATPENLLGPSFQLSFSAVVGLIAAYETWKNPIERWLGKGGFIRKPCVYSGGVAFTSLIATLATMPFTIMTFNQFTLMSIFANMLAVPLTAFFVMPSALLTLVSMLFGLENYTLPLLGYAIELLQHIAQYASAVPGSQILVPAPSPSSFYLIVFGGLWFCLWSQSWRYFGAVPMFMGVVLLVLTPRPHILIDEQGKLVAIRGDDGQIYVTSKRKGKFQREMWLRSLGESTVSLMPCEGPLCEMSVQGKVIQVVTDPQTHQASPDLFINLSEHSCSHSKSCISKADLTRDGAHAVYVDGGGAMDIKTSSTHNRF